MGLRTWRDENRNIDFVTAYLAGEFIHRIDGSDYFYLIGSSRCRISLAGLVAAACGHKVLQLAAILQKISVYAIWNPPLLYGVRPCDLRFGLAV